ncbi:helix-turn-helix domain-containing protein [Nocardia sp. CA-129566]|uniref:helix-turn-helix domain-containing protein n=1 Tax=Nocardia sp. CA-129566 TaxID=3239976 RepID=UPI003D97B871
MSNGADRGTRVVVESSAVRSEISVGRYTGYREMLDSAVLHREIPSSDVVLLIGFAESVQMIRSARGPVGGSSRNVVSALRTGVAVTRHRGLQHGIAIRLDPLCAYRLFAVPMQEISDDLVDPTAMLGRFGALLTERLAETRSWRDRFALLDRALAARIACGPAPDPEVSWAWRTLRNGLLAVSIADLAERVGWSRRHFERRFRHQIGLPPHTVARVLRFERALAALADSGGTFAEVAARAGYSDHAHFARDVRSRTGATPGQLAQQCRPQR